MNSVTTVGPGTNGLWIRWVESGGKWFEVTELAVPPVYAPAPKPPLPPAEVGQEWTGTKRRWRLTVSGMESWTNGGPWVDCIFTPAELDSDPDIRRVPRESSPMPTPENIAEWLVQTETKIRPPGFRIGSGLWLEVIGSDRLGDTTHQAGIEARASIATALRTYGNQMYAKGVKSGQSVADVDSDPHINRVDATSEPKQTLPPARVGQEWFGIRGGKFHGISWKLTASGMMINSGGGWRESISTPKDMDTDPNIRRVPTPPLVPTREIAEKIVKQWQGGAPVSSWLVSEIADALTTERERSTCG